MAASDAMGPWWEAIVHPPTEIPDASGRMRPPAALMAAQREREREDVLGIQYVAVTLGRFKHTLCLGRGSRLCLNAINYLVRQG